jgi:hypothetical protein
MKKRATDCDKFLTETLLLIPLLALNAMGFFARLNCDKSGISFAKPTILAQDKVDMLTHN